MTRWLRPILVVVALTGAFCVTFVWPRQNGLDFDIDTSPRAQAAKKRLPYDLSQVRVLKTVIAKVNQNYVEPQRISYHNMLLAGLNAIQRAVAPVMVRYETGQPTFRIQVNNGSKTGFPRIYFNGGGDAQKVLTIQQWGTGKK